MNISRLKIDIIEAAENIRKELLVLNIILSKV